MNKFIYSEPLVEEIEIAVEQGFAGSLESPEPDEDQDL